MFSQKIVHFVSVSILILAGSSAHSEDGFYGMPERKTEVIGTKSETTTVDKSKRFEFHVKIERMKNETKPIFIWRTRDDKPMFLATGKEYDTYTAVDGSGFVKVSRNKKDPTGFKYVECLTLGLAVVCYHGY